MLKSLTISSFKAFSEKPVTVPLRPFTVLVGPNGAGKSTILQAIELMGSLAKGTLNEYLKQKEWEYSDLPHLRAAQKFMSFDANLDIDGRSVHWSVTLGQRRHPAISNERVISLDPSISFMDRDGRRMARLDEKTRKLESITQVLTSSWLANLDLDRDRERFPTLVGVADWARRIHGYFFLSPVDLRSKGRGKPDEIGSHGQDLAAFVARLKKNDGKALQSVLQKIKKLYPRLVDIRPRQSQYGWTQLEIEEKWNGDAARFNARQVSDGLLRMIAFAAMQEYATPASVLLIDEVENGLHPHLLESAIGLLTAVSKRKGTQVIVTTHSPLTVSYCDPESVLIVQRGAGGGPEAVPLTETKSYAKLGSHFDAGELWYNLGERKLR